MLSRRARPTHDPRPGDTSQSVENLSLLSASILDTPGVIATVTATLDGVGQDAGKELSSCKLRTSFLIRTHKKADRDRTQYTKGKTNCICSHLITLSM